ncbi:right-handed parallel beta-helix repeat-containing protein [Paenibacillus sp. J5C_2022]|uniref:right-handed parallel beta-helix repeat-containing protein n=1 Tax=Paenibacillus sp. J5C2022 TaxID=2977129 RepID=UPI0021D3D983|nr:right-handed parallel beta-helix repeat-containing protein [Paenibacillus sp. J5C2022]MCU6710289.1 right-handed parallel beta-helix repeat-containing protein [Paenibacillus sp. J5C2022]
MPLPFLDQHATYVIDLNKFGIKNDGTAPQATRLGINNALLWAKAQGYNHIVLPGGTYLIDLDTSDISKSAGIVMQSGMHFQLSPDTEIRLQGNTSPNYNMIYMKGVHNVKLSGGKIIGDKKAHQYEMRVAFMRGGVNPDGSLNNNPNWIRSEVIDRYANPGLLSHFRLWEIDGVDASGYHFYQYRDWVSRFTLAGYRTNGLFAPGAPTGRGWFLDDISLNNKMVFAIQLSSPLTDAEIASIKAKVDNMYYTHEGGHGVGIYGGNRIQIENVDISNCTGDGIFTNWEEYHSDPSLYTQEQMGGYLQINDCLIHHCRRQGISICSTNDVHILRNKIHDIGYDDDGVTTDFRNGTPPMFGIDIESMVGESNIPYQTPDQPDGLELNYRIAIQDNYIHNNVRGHFVNADGNYIMLQGNTFKGWNVGGIISHSTQQSVKFIDNTFLGSLLVVEGDSVVDGALFQGGTLKLANTKGAIVQNVKMKDASLSGGSTYGYFGTPTVNVGTGVFTLPFAHGMGNGAKLVFEQWVGRLPGGISVDKLYYTVNITSNSFQVSESPGGPPVMPDDAGEGNFNVSRYNYGRCYMNHIVLERDWRADSSLQPNFNILTSGIVMKNITVKNYDMQIMVPAKYAGRPNVIEGLTLMEGAVRFEGSSISSSEFMRMKTGVFGGKDVELGLDSANYTRQIDIRNSKFVNVGVQLNGNSSIIGSTFLDAAIGKGNTDNKAVVLHSYLDRSKVNAYWLNKENSFTLASSVLKATTVSGSDPYLKLLNNVELES